MSLRWSEEDLSVFEKRRQEWIAKGVVRTHTAQDDNPAELPPISKKPRGSYGSTLEKKLKEQIEACGLPQPRREFKAIRGRQFRLDFAWPRRRIGLEVQGMVHRIKGRFSADMEKRALHLLAGWRVLEVGGKEVRSKQAIKWLQELLR